MLFLNLKFKYHLYVGRLWKILANLLLRKELNSLAEKAVNQYGKHVEELEKINNILEAKNRTIEKPVI